MAGEGRKLHVHCLDVIDPYSLFDLRSCFGDVVDSHVKDFGFNNVARLVGGWCREPTEVTNAFFGQRQTDLLA